MPNSIPALLDGREIHLVEKINIKKDKNGRPTGRTTRSFAMVDLSTNEVVSGFSVERSALPNGLDTPVEIAGKTVPMTRGSVIVKDRKTRKPTGASHPKVSGELELVVDGTPMVAKALISEPRDDRFYVSLAVVNPSGIGVKKPARSASALFAANATAK